MTLGGFTDGMTNIVERFDAEGLERDDRIGGLILGVTSVRAITITEGTLWSRLNEFAVSALDTTVSGTFETYWTKFI